MGVKMVVSSASLNSQALQSSSWTYNETSQVLKFTQLSSMTAGGAWASSWTLSWQ
jgi:alpha-glucosidase